jgi:hypothetical protein
MVIIIAEDPIDRDHRVQIPPKPTNNITSYSRYFLLTSKIPSKETQLGGG